MLLAGTLASLMMTEWKLLEEFRAHDLLILHKGSGHLVASLVVQSTLLQKIKEAQSKDLGLRKLMEDEEKSARVGLRVANDGLVKLGGRVCVPKDAEIKAELL